MQEAETDGFRELVETIRCCDYLIIQEATRRSAASPPFKVHFFETFQVGFDGSFRYDLLCKERRVADKDLPVCSMMPLTDELWQIRCMREGAVKLSGGTMHR